MLALSSISALSFFIHNQYTFVVLIVSLSVTYSTEKKQMWYMIYEVGHIIH